MMNGAQTDRSGFELEDKGVLPLEQTNNSAKVMHRVR